MVIIANEAAAHVDKEETIMFPARKGQGSMVVSHHATVIWIA